MSGRDSKPAVLVVLGQALMALPGVRYIFRRFESSAGRIASAAHDPPCDRALSQVTEAQRNLTAPRGAAADACRQAHRGNIVTELLRRLQRALPQVENWIDELHARHRREATRVIDAGLPRLGASFPSALLAATRVAFVAAIPFPPVSVYGLPEFEAMADMPMAGITFRDMYFVDPSHASEGVHFHEMIHVVQWQTLGVRPFLLTYALGIIQHGYEQSPLEAIAFDFQARFERGRGVSSVVEHVAGHALQARQDAAAIFRAHGLELGV